MLWNVSVKNNKNVVVGYTFEAEGAAKAVDKAELLYGTVIRICLAEYDED